MISSQPQLLKIPLDPGDVVYTPEWVVNDMISFFRPGGRILEPCAGDGAFLRHLPEGTLWCEIEKGVDFYAWKTPVDWLIGNPPYKQFMNWMFHSMDIASDIVYVWPCDKPFISWKMLEKMRTWGRLKHMRVYGPGRRLGFPVGFAVGALHFQRGYFGNMEMSFYQS